MGEHPVDDRLLTVEEAAQRLRIGRGKAYAMASVGSLPGTIRLGRTLRVSAGRLEEWIAQNAADPKPAA